MTHPLFVPLPSSLVTQAPPQPQDPPIGCSDSELKLQFPGLRQPTDTRPIVVVPTGDLSSWKTDLFYGYRQIRDLPADLTSSLNRLDGVLADSKKYLIPDEYLTLNSVQSGIHKEIDAYATLETRMKGLYDAVNQMQPAPADMRFAITETTEHNGNVIVPVWDLNSSNKLAQIAARVKADKYPDDFTLNVSTLTDTPAKQTVAEYTANCSVARSLILLTDLCLSCAAWPLSILAHFSPSSQTNNGASFFRFNDIFRTFRGGTNALRRSACNGRCARSRRN